MSNWRSVDVLQYCNIDWTTQLANSVEASMEIATCVNVKIDVQTSKVQIITIIIIEKWGELIFKRITATRPKGWTWSKIEGKYLCTSLLNGKQPVNSKTSSLVRRHFTNEGTMAFKGTFTQWRRTIFSEVENFASCLTWKWSIQRGEAGTIPISRLCCSHSHTNRIEWWRLQEPQPPAAFISPSRSPPPYSNCAGSVHREQTFYGRSYRSLQNFPG